MISKTGILILLTSFLHFVCSFPPALVDGNKCKRGNGNFPKPGSFCRSYYSCRNWIPEEEVCPGDQHFYPAKGYCVWPEEYPCLEKSKSKECPLPNGKFLKPGTDCKVYYDCCDGRPTEKKCAEGLLFDDNTEKCDYPEYVTCPEEPKSKECTRRDGKFLKPGTGCKIFYHCTNGISVESRCPPDQLFDPEIEKCEWPEIYTCVEEPKSKECVRPTGKFLRPGTRCKIYYDCRNGVATEKRCRYDLLFDPTQERCEWPEVYTCVEDVSTTTSTSQSTSSFSITSTPVHISTKERINTTTSNTKSPKIVTPDEDSSSKEGTSSEESKSSEKGNSSEESKSSEEGNSSEENKKFSTKSEFKSTFTISPTTSDEYTESPEEEVTESSTESSSTVENSSEAVSSTATPDDSSTISEISTESSTGEYDLKTSTYPTVSTKETLSSVTEVVTGETHSEIYTESSTGEYDLKTSTYPKVSTEETLYSVSEVVTDETHSEIYTESSTGEYDLKTSIYPRILTEETHSSVIEVVTGETHPEATDTVENKYSTAVTSGLTDTVTTHIFCPKLNGYFPHPYDRHKFIACVGGNPTIMNCPEDLVYDHKKRSCEYKY